MRVTVKGNSATFWRNHVCEVVLFVLLAIPVVAVRPSLLNVGLIVLLAGALFAVGYCSDMATELELDDDGVHYLPGGHRPIFLAWQEIDQIVPRTFRGWPAENALVVLDQAGHPLLVASVSMFETSEVAAALDYAERHVAVQPSVQLSPFSGKADGVARPDLVPERTSERFLASSAAGLLLACVIGLALFLLVEL